MVTLKGSNGFLLNVMTQRRMHASTCLSSREASLEKMATTTRGFTELSTGITLIRMLRAMARVGTVELFTMPAVMVHSLAVML